MDYDVAIIFDGLLSMLKDIYHSSFLLGVKIFIGVYLTVLFIDIVLLLMFRGVASQYRTGVKGADVPLVSKNKLRKRWDEIMERLESGNPSQYKVAVIEADAIAEEFLGGVGYKGENMTQKLEQVGDFHLDEHREALAEVHKLRNRIVHEADFEVDHETAVAAVEVYESFLKYLQFL